MALCNECNSAQSQLSISKSHLIRYVRRISKHDRLTPSQQAQLDKLRSNVAITQERWDNLDHYCEVGAKREVAVG
jgi:hypothetical protein